MSNTTQLTEEQIPQEKEKELTPMQAVHEKVNNLSTISRQAKKIVSQLIKDSYPSERQAIEEAAVAFFDWWGNYIKEKEFEVFRMPFDNERREAAIAYKKLCNLPTKEKYQLFPTRYKQ